MTSSIPNGLDPDSLDAAAIADATARLAMLRRLADLGMRLTEEICQRAMDAPYNPEPRHEPGRAFATISRAVRLTLVLQERVEAKLIALRKHQSAPAENVARARIGSPSEAAPDHALDDAPERSDRLRETLREREGERFDDMVRGRFDDCVTAVRVDLGLKPGEAIPSSEDEVEAALQAVLAKAGSDPPLLKDATRSGPPLTPAPALVSASPPPDSG